MHPAPTLAALTLGLARSRRVMATLATVTVVGHDPASLAEVGLDELARLESLWSRFITHSDISRLNRAGGAPVEVAPETVALLAHMQAAHLATRGSFDPTRLRAQIAAGDDASLDGRPLPVFSATEPTPDTANADDDAAHREPLTCDEPWWELPTPTVVVPRPGIVLDAGGIGKGLAADLVATSLIERGADAVCVNIGGDLRISSRATHPLDWPVVIGAPRGATVPDETISLRSGAVATSDVAARQRSDGSVPVHIMGAHAPVRGVAIGATVVAGTAAWAEAWTKHLLSVDHHAALADIDAAGLAARVVLRDGSVVRSSHWSEFLSPEFAS